jgi:hypothetical protein
MESSFRGNNFDAPNHEVKIVHYEEGHLEFINRVNGVVLIQKRHVLNNC